jgi:pimeloyl-ACP methyl ester carboxylesterase
MPLRVKERNLKTAVLVVHGMGSQRPLETVRGVMDALFPTVGGENQPKIWTHPERAGTDIDLPVITMIPPDERGRRIDFHEIYWAHLMSETRAVAVLLWLFELARKGPRLKPGTRALWYGGAIFLCLLVLSITFLVIQGIAAASGILEQMRPMLSVPFVFLLAVALAIFLSASFLRAFRLAEWALYGVLAAVAAILILLKYIDDAAPAVIQLLPIIVAAVAVWILMGKWGMWAFLWAGVLSLSYSWLMPLLSHHLMKVPLHDLFWKMYQEHWTLDKNFTAVGSWLIITSYLALNVAFLQPYLGDAARYFRNAPANVAVRRDIRRQAVEMLEGLHKSQKYDRIIVIAHSLGTVVAYDMLRAYFGRVCDCLPADPKILGKQFDQIDSGAMDFPTLRREARMLVARMAKLAMPAHAKKSKTNTADDVNSTPPLPSAWLVTDFVTLGSPLTHAEYLMCNGNTKAALEHDFRRRKSERELPTCPPEKLGHDGWLTFEHARKSKRRVIHHGAQFALTRWTNLYFERSELFWGDAIGGPLREVFGEAIMDVKVSTHTTGEADFFTHTTYWDTRRTEGRHAPHIVELSKAINLDDV